MKKKNIKVPKQSKSKFHKALSNVQRISEEFKHFMPEKSVVVNASEGIWEMSHLASMNKY